MSILANFLHSFCYACHRFLQHYEHQYLLKNVASRGKGSILYDPKSISYMKKIYLRDNSCIQEGATIIINPNGADGIFVMGENSVSAANLVVVTGNHNRKLGTLFRDTGHSVDKDAGVIVEEDVWIGANVILCSGARIGRGANIGAGSVVRSIIPPYSIVIGNPAKVVGFCFTPTEVIEHEKQIYPENKRLSIEILEKNYSKYFLNRLKEINNFTKI